MNKKPEPLKRNIQQDRILEFLATHRGKAKNLVEIANYFKGKKDNLLEIDEDEYKRISKYPLSKAKKELIEAEIIIEKDNSLMLNPIKEETKILLTFEMQVLICNNPEIVPKFFDKNTKYTFSQWSKIFQKEILSKVLRKGIPKVSPRKLQKYRNYLTN